MGKNPAFQFYPSDWTRDTAMLPLDVKGAWVDLLCAMWWNHDRGKVSGSYEDFGRLLRVDHEKAKQIIDHLTEKKVCDITKYNGNITLVSRRMVREENERKNNLLRQKRYHEAHEDNGELQKYNGDITVPSSTSSSSSTTKQENTTVEPFFKCDYFEVHQDKVSEYCFAYELNEHSLMKKLVSMKLWLDANPTKRKKNYERFITNWLKGSKQPMPKVPGADTASGKHEIKRLLKDVRMRRNKLKVVDGGTKGGHAQGNIGDPTGGDKGSEAIEKEAPTPAE